jgi:pimeloyl-ACP methyl ester carboxylesterase
MIDLAPVARRTDHAAGFREEIAFVPVGGEGMFTVMHLPDRGASFGVLICCSILVEHLTNYRHEVLLARSLAARGVAVMRFHYRGTGHSSGTETGVSLSTMIEDAHAALDHCRERTGVARLGFMGTRWGALVAAGAADAHPDGPLALWDPVFDGGRYFRELIRGRLVREMKDTRFASPASSWLSEMEQKGFIDVLGHPLHRALYESGHGARLETVIATRRGPLLLVQFGRHGTLHADYQRLKESRDAHGADTEVQFIRDEPAWFFPGHRMTSTGALIATTSDWLAGIAS